MSEKEKEFDKEAQLDAVNKEEQEGVFSVESREELEDSRDEASVEAEENEEEEETKEAAKPAANGGGRAWMYISIGLAIVLLVFLVKSPFGSSGGNETVGSVNGTSITKDQLYDAMAKVGGQQTLDNLIQDELVKQEADKKGIVIGDKEVDAEIAKIKKQFPTDADFEAALQQAGMSLDDLKAQTPMQLRISKLVEPQVKVTDDDVKKYFDENKATFDEPEQVKASHILVATKEEADAIEKQLKDGGDFAAIAKEKSTDPGSKDAGGDLGYFSADKMDPDFAKVAFELKAGETSAPVKTQFGYHIIKVFDHKAGKQATLDEKKADIKDTLIRQKVSELSPTWLADLKSKSQITNTLKQDEAAAPEAAAPETTTNGITN
ncbi:peptidylprolyl isomerase [Paenibacillus sp. OV219]|uniref:peptidylprolyl isomerase n=1 Tax=Paenibacillus sp. OV219 TaxID=1884377 RepID=UPI0008B4F085|nr:peptidylprolyl isomerase [Paenibacillus sp. OV219]SEN29364.1 foldase protein PrsA [Paenibacillus sp. OV219]